MRENRLTPVSESSHDPSGKLPAERAKAQLERHTRYWPMIISQTTIFNMQAVSSMQRYSSSFLITSAKFSVVQVNPQSLNKKIFGLLFPVANLLTGWVNLDADISMPPC